MIYDDNYLISKIKISSQKEDLGDLSSYVRANENSKTLANALSEIRLIIGEAMKTDNIALIMANGCSIYAGSKSTTLKSEEMIEDDYSLIKDDLSCALKGDVETQLNSLTVLKDYYSIKGDAEKLKAVEEYISKKKEQLLSNFVFGIDYNKLYYHNILLLKLRSYGVLSKTSFYTPNYDLAIEYSLDELHTEYNNGFSGFVYRAFNPASFNSYRPNVVKIHGSLNWKYDEEKGQIIEIQPTFDKGLICKVPLENSIIYPTSEKLFKTYNTPYSELLRFMLNNLQEKRNAVFVIGYKYKDAHINDVLLKALSNPMNVFFFFDYDNSECEFMDKIKELEKTISNINILSGTSLADFSTFVRYLLPATAEKTDQERIGELLQKVIPYGKN